MYRLMLLDLHTLRAERRLEVVNKELPEEAVQALLVVFVVQHLRFVHFQEHELFALLGECVGHPDRNKWH